MKKFGLLLAPLLLLFSAVPVLAQRDSLKAKRIVTLPEGEVHEGNYYAAGEIVEIFGDVTGDVYAAGGQVMVNGDIGGDLIVAGGTVSISGTVGQDVRVAGGQITINSKVAQNVSVAGGNVELTSTSSVGRGLQAAGGNVIIAAPVSEEISLASGNATISSTVGDGIDAKVGSLRITASAQVNGDVNYWSDEEARIDETASISGTVNPKLTEEEYRMPTEKEVTAFFQAIGLIVSFTSFITTLIVGLLLIRLLPNHLVRAAAIVKEKVWVSLGLGFLVLVLMPVLFIALFVSVIGIPFALMLGAIFVVYVFIARIYVMHALGQLILERTGAKGHVGWAFVTGLLAYYVVGMVPIIGGLAKLVVLIVGLGASLQADKAGYSLAKEKKIV